jgi:hypothetical protein
MIVHCDPIAPFIFKSVIESDSKLPVVFLYIIYDSIPGFEIPRIGLIC